MDDADAALLAGDSRLAKHLLEQARHALGYAKGKDIRSDSDQAKFGREFGKCVSESEHDQFDDCFTELKAKVEQHVEDRLSNDDKDRNVKIKLRLQKLADKAGIEVSALLDDFAGYNFSGLDESEVIDDVESVLDVEDDDKAEKLLERMEKIKHKARLSKFKAGVIPFKDTDDEDWYFSFVDQMNSESCVTGYQDADGNALGEFRPGNEVRFGESVKFVVECLLKEKPEAKTVSEHWAKRHALVLKEQFADLLDNDILAEVDLALNDDAEFGKAFTRAELIQLIVDVLNLDDTAVTESPFVDVDLGNPHVGAIALAKKLGLITGDAEFQTFRPNDVPNRAEVAKLIMLAKELL